MRRPGFWPRPDRIMKDLILVSDVHLYPEPEEHPGRELFLEFLSFLEKRPVAGELWILGDLFDFWFEYGSTVPAGHQRILSALGRLSARGWAVRFMPGNHDFWVGRHFQAATGVMVHTEQVAEIELGGRTILLAHGDGLGSGDIGYRIIKPILRSGPSRFLFRLLHPDLGSFLARAFSNTSRRMLRKEADAIPPGLAGWVAGKLEGGADIIITGHTHLDAVIRRENGIHVSLGDWLVRMTYCIVPCDGGEPVLETWTGDPVEGHSGTVHRREGSADDER